MTRPTDSPRGEVKSLSIDLEACPFCDNSMRGDFTWSGHEPTDTSAATCFRCGAQGPTTKFSDVDGAFALWNKRPHARTPVRDEVEEAVRQTIQRAFNVGVLKGMGRPHEEGAVECETRVVLAILKATERSDGE